MKNGKTPVFVWRSDNKTTEQGPHCPYCNTYIEKVSFYDLKGMDQKYFKACEDAVKTVLDDPFWTDNYVGEGNFWNNYKLYCPVCGWWSGGITNWNGERFKRVIEAALIDFDINSEKLSLAELNSHLSRKYKDVYALSSRRFEELIALVYSNQGWEVELTKQTRDGGVDIFCLKRNSGEQCIIECKKYAEKRKVGISEVDRFLGAAFRINSSSAHIVTSSSFTKPAKKAQKSAIQRGIELELIDGFELLKTINAFADQSLTVSEIKKIYSTQ